ncbi:MAG TPA: chemotaxis protein CheB [Ramlibacter sp.]
MDENLFAIAIGASTGGIEALLALVGAMPPQFPGSVLVTQHIGGYPSILPQLMRARGPNPAMHPGDGDPPLAGTIYIAPPDHHMIVEEGRMRLFRGPKENHCRPAIDPMMRSVAMAFGARSIGVVLTGFLDDGTAGLKAIKECGGTAIVQDPASAVEPSMPRSALENVDVDLCLRIDEMVPAFLRIMESRGSALAAVPGRLQREQMIAEGKDIMDNLESIARPSALTCPDCGGGLWELKDRKPLRYRCHTGHAFTAISLEHAQSEDSEHALWNSVRALHEREMLLRRVALVARGHGDHAQASSAEEQARHARQKAEQLTDMIEGHDGGA